MNTDALITSPSAHFISVKQLLECDLLSKKEKITALNNWKATCELLQASDDEGMEGVIDAGQLSKVVKALDRLEH